MSAMDEDFHDPLILPGSTNQSVLDCLQRLTNAHLFCCRRDSGAVLHILKSSFSKDAMEFRDMSRLQAFLRRQIASCASCEEQYLLDVARICRQSGHSDGIAGDSPSEAQKFRDSFRACALLLHAKALSQSQFSQVRLHSWGEFRRWTEKNEVEVKKLLVSVAAGVKYGNTYADENRVFQDRLSHLLPHSPNPQKTYSFPISLYGWFWLHVTLREFQLEVEQALFSLSTPNLRNSPHKVLPVARIDTMAWEAAASGEDPYIWENLFPDETRTSRPFSDAKFDAVVCLVNKDLRHGDVILTSTPENSSSCVALVLSRLKETQHSRHGHVALKAFDRALQKLIEDDSPVGLLSRRPSVAEGMHAKICLFQAPTPVLGQVPTADPARCAALVGAFMDGQGPTFPAEKIMGASPHISRVNAADSLRFASYFWPRDMVDVVLAPTWWARGRHQRNVLARMANSGSDSEIHQAGGATGTWGAGSSRELPRIFNDSQQRVLDHAWRIFRAAKEDGGDRPRAISQTEPAIVDKECLMLGVAPSDTHDNAFTVVRGPPGTGKSRVLVEVLLSSLQFEDLRVLVVAHSNKAVDNILDMFLTTWKSRLDQDAAIRNSGRHRDGVDDRDAMAYPPCVRTGSGVLDEERSPRAADLEELSRTFQKSQKNVLDEASIVFTTIGGSGHGNLSTQRFDILVVDEAGQAPEFDLLVPLCRPISYTTPILHVLLFGDPDQLPPTIINQDAVIRSYCSMSLFERLEAGLFSCEVCRAKPLLERCCQSFFLNTQYRMHPLIARFVNDEIYAGKLSDGVTAKDRSFGNPNMLHPINFVDMESMKWNMDSDLYQWQHSFSFVGLPLHVEPKESRQGTSRQNESEANAVVNLLCTLLMSSHLKRQGSDESFLICSPYLAQVVLLKEKVCSAAKFLETKYARKSGEDPRQLGRAAISRTIHSLRTMMVSTVDAMQGQEADVVIVSCVRSSQLSVNRKSARQADLKFIEDRNRVNVIITRAKRCLIAVGSRSTIELLGSADSIWKKFISFCEYHGGVFSNANFLEHIRAEGVNIISKIAR